MVVENGMSLLPRSAGENMFWYRLTSEMIVETILLILLLIKETHLQETRVGPKSYKH